MAKISWKRGKLEDIPLFLNAYLFLWLHGITVVACRILVAAHGLLSVVCAPSCSMARGTLAPQPGLEPKSSALQGGLLTTGPPGKSWKIHTSNFKTYYKTTKIKTAWNWAHWEYRNETLHLQSVDFSSGAQHNSLGKEYSYQQMVLQLSIHATEGGWTHNSCHIQKLTQNES